MKLPFIVRPLFVMVLFAVAVSTHAQQCPGYNPTMYQSPNPGTTSAYNPPSPCAGHSINSTASFSQTNGVASCTPVVVYCYPSFELEVTVATNQQDYNRFYNRAYDYTYTSSGCARTPINRQDFFQCAWYSCPPPPSGECYDAYGNCAFDCSPSPVIFDLNGEGFRLTDATNGVVFDISGTGHPIRMGWTAPGADNAFLALPGADGLVRNGKQLFGNFTSQPASNTPNGFAALAVYDDPKNGGNGDGVIDSRDAIFTSLRLWIDANHDGISQPEELHTLPSLGVTSISLNYKAAQRTDQYGNVFRYRAQVDPGDSTNTGRMAYDVFFVTSQPTSKNIPRGLIRRGLIPADADAQKCAVPLPTKGGMLSTTGSL